MRSIVAIVLMAVFGAAALTSNYIAMVMYWWYALFRPHEWMWWDISALRIPLIAACLFLAYSLASSRLPRFDSLTERLIGLFALATGVSQLASECQSIYALTYSHVLILATVILLTSRLLDSYARATGLALFIAAFFGINAAGLGLTTALSSGSLYDVRVGGGGITGSNAVALASAMSTFLLLPFVPILRENYEEALFPWMRAKIVRRLLLWLVLYLILGLVAFVYVSDSRGSAISLALGGIVWMCLQRRRMLWLSGATLAITMAFTLDLVPEAYVARISTAFAEEGERDNSAESRPHFWGVGIDMANKHPFGVGVGCYMTQYEFYDPSDGQFGRLRSSHSSYFNIAAELGYIGLFLWLLLNAVTLHALWRVRRFSLRRSSSRTDCPERFLLPLASGLLASHVAFLAGGLFYEFSYNDITWVMFVIAAALLKLVRRSEALSRIEENDQHSDTTPELRGTRSQ